MIEKLRAAHLTTVNVIMAFLVLNFIFLSALTGLIIYGMQINDQRHADTEKLEAAIAISDKAATHNTDRLVKQTIDASDRNYVALQERANVSNSALSDILNKLEQTSQNLTSQNLQLLHIKSATLNLTRQNAGMLQEVIGMLNNKTR